MLSTTAGRFRTVAIAEAVSWAGLLIGMLFKHVVVETEVGVQVFGWIHGVVFVLYFVVAALTWRALEWSLGTATLAVLAGFPPFATVVFERWATRRGLLHERPAAAALGTTGA